MQKIILIVILAAGLVSPVFAQETKEQRGAKLGFELDAFPFINNGYYGSAWVGAGNLRFRGVIASTTVPSFVVEDGFSDLKTTAYAVIVDYFFKPNYEGWWLGAGAEYWQNNVKNSSNDVTGDFNNAQFTVGGGYAWKIWGNFYLNPWGAFHLRMAGDSKTDVGGKEYKSAVFLPEASVKFGWYF